MLKLKVNELKSEQIGIEKAKYVQRVVRRK